MSLSIPQRYILDLENFTWGKDWRATTIVKEKRSDDEYYFANIRRYYGEKEHTHDYDVGETFAETAWLGRNEKFVGKRTHDRDIDSKTFGRRIYSEAITEKITEPDAKGRPIERTILVEGRTIYDFTLPVNEQNTKKLKTICGAIALNQETQFLFMYGINPPLVVMPDTFWKISVNDYLTSLEKERMKDIGKKI